MKARVGQSSRRPEPFSERSGGCPAERSPRLAPSACTGLIPTPRYFHKEDCGVRVNGTGREQRVLSQITSGVTVRGLELKPNRKHVFFFLLLLYFFYFFLAVGSFG